MRRTSHEILARSSHLIAKALVIQHPRDIVVVSPYLATPNAELAVAWADKETAVILTTFEVETFATGASDIRTVKRLVDAGFHVRGLHGLHAKIVLADDAAIVGSQNLTNRGRRNKEATVLIRDREVVEGLRADLALWMQDSFRITLGMVADIERELDDLRDLIKGLSELRNRARKADGRMQRNRDKMAGESAPPLEAPPTPIPEILPEGFPLVLPEPEPRAPVGGVTVGSGSPSISSGGSGSTSAGGGSVRDKFAAAVNKSVPVREEISLRITYGESKTALDCRNRRENLIEWAEFIAGKTDDGFERRSRYLTICRETGRISWPTLNMHRLSNFSNWRPGSSDDAETPLTIKGMSIKVEANEKLDQDDRNIRFTLARKLPSGIEYFTLEAAFLLKHLDVLQVTGNSELLRHELEKEAADPNSDTYKTLIEAIFRPFRHARNSEGGSADTFCGGRSEGLVLRLRRAGEHHFFSVERSDFDVTMRQEAYEEESEPVV